MTDITVTMQDDAVESGYRAVCRELGLEPVERGPGEGERGGHPVVRSLAEARAARGRDTVLVLDEAGMTTVAIVAGDWSSGCPDCLHSKVLALAHYYSGDRDDPLDVEAAIALVARVRDRHGVVLALTDGYRAQNWSVCVAVPGCAGCATRERSPDDLARALGQTVAEPAPTSTVAAPAPAPLEHPAIEHDPTAGLRGASGAEFVARNRAAIGFASILGNPVAVEEELEVSLLNAPVFVAGDPEAHEVAGGKGADVEQSLASCVGEGLERYLLAGAYRLPATIATREELGDAACSPTVEFGFPARDAHPGVERYRDDLEIEWVLADDLHTGERRFVPANLVYCPYLPGGGAPAISVGSTNGAATGATVADATRQALLESVERDAFWYYARTGIPPLAVSQSCLPRDVEVGMSVMRGQFFTHVLENPFGVPVAHVTFESDVLEGARSARGTGATPRLESSIRRAYAECMQMYHSLSTGIAVDRVTTDMRHAWFTGRSRSLFPALFTRGRPPGGGVEALPGVDPALEILASAREQGLSAYRVVLAETDSFAVVKVLVGGMALMDATYFEYGHRFHDLARSLGHPEPRLRYTESLFM
ncbi:YcaO-like family protein [Antiquaquibacter soli]|uniref:YcaO-like family protein n=1 Tax=Antiquaquibacter soli TaxID=3064523 RepID=A0ABT9BNK9_9MICO|nr:YcaO-like family protein [Protaetiibacter sp. WY-16]MDO7882600.1 YcaO-like family protein [Protaetiibacter sp. WY-16]